MDANNLFGILKSISPLLPLGGLLLYSFKRNLNKADKIDEEERSELLALHKEERELFNQAAEKLGTIFPVLYSATAHTDRILNIEKNKNNDIDNISRRKEYIQEAIGITKKLRSSLVEIEAKNKAYSGNNEFSKKYKRIIEELEGIHRTIDEVTLNIEEKIDLFKIYNEVLEAINKLKKWEFSNKTKQEKEEVSIHNVLKRHEEVIIGRNEIYDLCRLRLNCILYRYKDLPDYLEKIKRVKYEAAMKEKYIGDSKSYIIENNIFDKFNKLGVEKIMCSFINWKGFLGNIFYLLHFKVYWLMLLIIFLYIPTYTLMFQMELNTWWYIVPILFGSLFISVFGEYFIYKNYIRIKKYIERKVKKYKERIDAMEYIGHTRWFNKLSFLGTVILWVGFGLFIFFNM